MYAWCSGLAFPAAAAACPVCLSDTGAAVRDGIFAAGFLENVAIALAPFILAALLAEVVAARVAGTGRRGLRDGRGRLPRRSE